MIAAIPTTSPACYTVRQLADVGQLRGHEMLVVDCNECIGESLGQLSESPSIVSSFVKTEAIFAWLDSRDLECGLAVMRECKSFGAYSPNTATAITRACDRL